MRGMSEAAGTVETQAEVRTGGIYQGRQLWGTIRNMLHDVFLLSPFNYWVLLNFGVT